MVQKLYDYLKGVPEGPMNDTSELEVLLYDAWEEFDGSSATNMEPRKIGGRIEDVHWNDPELSFVIERHGGYVSGSKRAELIRWVINLDTKSATWGQCGVRQLIPTAPKLDVRPIAQEIAGLIFGRKEDDRLKWQDDNTVRVLIGKVIPEDGVAAKQTISSRRKRFRKELNNILPTNWQEDGYNKYRYVGE